VKSSLRSSRPAAGRPHRSQHEIEAILRRHRLSGLSLLAFARENDLNYATLLRWRRRAVDQSDVQTPAPDSTPTFIPIELEPAAAGADFVLNWAPSRSLRIPPGFDPAELRRLLDVLGVRS
jgi:hypothetical protein